MRIALTAGDPAGIGPDVTLMLAQNAREEELLVFADRNMLIERAQLLALPITLHCAQTEPITRQAGHLSIVPLPTIKPVSPGRPCIENAKYVLKTLHAAVEACQTKKVTALVTGPVNKKIIAQSGITFSGHTELLAQLTHTPRVVMMLASPTLRVALATTHLPLREVPAAITPTLLYETLSILHHDLTQRFAIHNPHIIVCGLNPHAGEGGYLGDEEVRIINPVLQELRQQGLNITGPVAADTAFLQKADVILAMYHDQGLPVLKSHGFFNAVNVTLGLPFIRTSVDHGTAFELAGTGQANPNSLQSAITMATQLAHSWHTSHENGLDKIS